MSHLHLVSVLCLTALVACSQQEGPGEDDPADGPPACDGIFQTSEGVKVDGTFDKDGDGAFDANVAACVAYYGNIAVDCDDNDPAINPNAVEVACDGIDNDCKASTEDEPDQDGDGSISCDDCNDLDEDKSPDLPETCFDGIDNDCDGTVDNDCGPNYNGVFVVTPGPTYQCSIGLVSMDFDKLQVAYAPPLLTMYPTAGGQPGTMTGGFDTDTGSVEGAFTVDNLIAVATPPGCEEYYVIQGEFTDEDHFTGQLFARYSGFGCLNCNNQLFPFTAVREGQTTTGTATGGTTGTGGSGTTP